MFSGKPIKKSLTRVRVFWFLRKTFFFLALCLALASLYFALFSWAFKTPAEKALARENALMQSEYDRLRGRERQLDTVLAELEARDREIYRRVLQAEPLSFDTREEDDYLHWGVDSCLHLANRNARRYVELSYRASHIASALEDMARRLRDSLPHKDYLPLGLPLERLTTQGVGAGTGKKMHPFYKILTEHDGWDLTGGLGTSVLATAHGTVALVEKSRRGRGYRVVLRHGETGYETEYAHLSDVLVRRGAQVRKGMVIGRVGNTGMSLLPHLHYAVRKDGRVMEPVHFVAVNLHPLDYTRFLLTSANTGQSLD